LGDKNIKQKKQNDKNLVEKGSKILICKEKWEKLVNRKYEVKQKPKFKKFLDSARWIDKWGQLFLEISLFPSRRTAGKV